MRRIQSVLVILGAALFALGALVLLPVGVASAANGNGTLSNATDDATTTTTTSSTTTTTSPTTTTTTSSTTTTSPTTTTTIAVTPDSSTSSTTSTTAAAATAAASGSTSDGTSATTGASSGLAFTGIGTGVMGLVVVGAVLAIGGGRARRRFLEERVES